MTDTAHTQRIVMLQTLGNAPARLAGVVEQMPAGAEDSRGAPDEWTARETVTHLAAAEAPFLARLRRILAEDNPRVPYFGPDAARPDNSQLLDAALAAYRAEREKLLAFLSELAPEAWERRAVHETLGPTTLSLQVQNIISHDLEHLGQLHKTTLTWNETAHA